MRITSWLRWKEKEVVGDLVGEELAHLIAVDDLSEAGADLVLAAEGRLLPLGGDHDALEQFLGGLQQVLAFPALLGGKLGVAADDEALAGVFVGGDLEQVALLEQGGGRPLGVEELADHGLAEGGDPAQPLDALEVLADAGGGEHAPVARPSPTARCRRRS